ncbi:MAG: T9SS type A sorting domain-containing protein [Muribaculaceae bacterium]|nr:T9SS type A sorting domain-containing protein [Muribaculaceae bacterium]
MTRFAFFIIFCFCCLTNLATNILDLSTGKFCNNLSTKPLCSKVDYGDSIIITYDFQAAQIINDDIFQGCIQWKYEDWGINHTQGEASFPIKIDTYTTSQSGNISISLIESEFIDFNYELAPARQPLTDNGVNLYSSENISPIQAYSGFSPNEIIEIEDVQTHKDTSIYWVKISPVQYNHTNKIVRAYSKIKYKVTYQSSPQSRLSGIEIKPYPVLQDTITQDYIIISTNKYATAAKNFAKWKRHLGFNTEVALNDNWTPTSIKSKIREIYEKHSDNCYALIIGDHDDVPSNVSTLKPTDGIENSHLTDLYYGCFNGGDDYFPEIAIGRLPVSTLNEANVVVDKIINYEKNPPLNGSFYNTGVNCSFFQDENSDTFEDRLFIETSESVRNLLISKGKTIERIYNTFSDITPRYYANGTSLPSELLKPTFNWDGDYVDIINSINSGRFYILHRGHGYITFWDKPHFNIFNINNLSNGNLQPIVFSINCSTGNFDDDCFAETFLKKANGGCVGIFASSATSFSPYNDFFTTAIFGNIWPNSNNVTSEYRLGYILNNSQYRVAVNHDTYANIRRYQCEIYHCFGDPSMMIRTENPSIISNVFVTRNAESGKAVNVSISGSEDEYIAFNDNILGKTLLIKGRSAIYRTNFPEYVTVCVYNHNKIPYVNLGLEPEIVQTISITDSADCISNFGPNPTNGQISFEYSISNNTSSAVIIISDLYGNLKTSTTCIAENNSITIDLSHLNNGVYIATLIVDGVTKDTKRVIVQK